MCCIAEKVVLPKLRGEDRKALLEKAALVSVYEILDTVPDPRGKHSLRYELSFLLTCLLAALLCNCVLPLLVPFQHYSNNWKL